MTRRQPKPQPLSPDAAPCMRRVEKPWGWEIVWAENGHYTGKLLHVRAGHRLSLQFHDEKLETQCLVSGSALLIVDASDGSLREIPMQPGRGYTIQPFQLHRLVALEDSDVIEVSTPERGTTVRVEDDYLRGDETDAVRALPDRGWRRT